MIDNKIFSYRNNQPNNDFAWRLGKLCNVVIQEPKCGDYIDRGLILMRELESMGYGLIKLSNCDRLVETVLRCKGCGHNDYRGELGESMLCRWCIEEDKNER